MTGTVMATDYNVSSPDGTITVVVNHEAGTGKISYSVVKGSSTVIESSALGINTDIEDFRDGLKFNSKANTIINETYSLPGRKKAVYRNYANELTLKFKKNSKQMHLVVRAYDDGMAYRYFIPGGGDININSEDSSFKLPANIEGWAQTAPVPNHYEAPYLHKDNFDTGEYNMPVLTKLVDGNWVFISESDIQRDYCGSHVLCSSGNVLNVVFAKKQTTVQATRPLKTPWRLAIVGTLKTIIESTLIENLATPSKIKDTSWIKPGRSGWSWWSGDSCSNYNVQVKYVDFCSAMGWEYYLCDEGWKASWVPDLCKYAATKNVGIILWSHYKNFVTDKKIKDNLSLWSKWGAKGIKVDYFDTDHQNKMILYDKIAQFAAKYKMVVNYHGSKKCYGERRTWPNILTREGVRGAEYYKWSQGASAADNCTYVFTRNVTGPMDYTPVTYSNCKNQTTWAHQTALDVVFESNIQHLADKWTSYDKNVAKPFLKDCPATWDDTVFIEGYPDQYVTIARRSGTDWYVGAICGSGTSRTLNLALTFLDPSKKYNAQIYKDGESDTDIVVEQQTVSSVDTLTIPLRINGGCAIRLTPQ